MVVAFFTDALFMFFAIGMAWFGISVIVLIFLTDLVALD